MKLDYPTGASILTLEQLEQLIPQHINTQSQLNEWEANNIQKAYDTYLPIAWIDEQGDYWIDENNNLWLTKQPIELSTLLNITYLKQIHQKMFNETWLWAGLFRKINTNIGIDKHQILIELQKLLDNTLYWIQKSIFPIQEIGVRFHHRLVEIHPFPNGNGRHARLMTDILLMCQKIVPFTWGNTNLTIESDTRKTYIHALREADRGNITPLLDFVIT